MIVQCEHCRTKFRLADDRITGKGVKVRCSKCAHVFTVHTAEENAALPPAPRVHASLVETAASPALDHPMHAGDLMAAIDDLMLPGGGSQSGGALLGGDLGRNMPTGGGLGALPPSALGAPSGFGGSMGMPQKPMLPESQWLAPAPAPLPPAFPPPPAPTQLNKRPSVPSIPAGRPPPGHHLPSVPKALLDSHGDLDRDTSDRLRALADLDGLAVHRFEDESPLGRKDASAEDISRLKAQEELAGLPIDREPPLQFDLRSHPPTMDLPPRPQALEPRGTHDLPPRPPTMEMPRPPSNFGRPPTMELPRPPDFGRAPPFGKPPDFGAPPDFGGPPRFGGPPGLGGPALPDLSRASAAQAAFGAPPDFGAPPPRSADPFRSPTLDFQRPSPLDRPSPQAFGAKPAPLEPRPPHIDGPPSMDFGAGIPQMERLMPLDLKLGASLPPPPGNVPERPSVELPPRQSWNLAFEKPSHPPSSASSGLPAKIPSSQSIRVPTFPPPPVFDPFLDAPKSLPPPASSGLSRVPAPSEQQTDHQFMIGKGTDDPFAGLGESFHPQVPAHEHKRERSSATELDLGQFDDTEEKNPQQIARLDLRKGLLGTAGVVTFGDPEPPTKIAVKSESRADLEAAGLANRPTWRTFALLGVLLVLSAVAVISERSNHETRVGGLAIFESKSFVPGAVTTIEAEQARVTAYPLRDPKPHLVVSGVAVNRGATLSGEIEVVALMLDGDKVIEQRQSPLGVLPLDLLAKAKTSAEVDSAWASAEKLAGPWSAGDSRSFMVVFPEVPADINRYTFRVEFRNAAPAQPSAAAN